MRNEDIQKEIDRMTNNRFVTDSIGTMEEQKEFDNKRNYVMTEKLIERLAIEAGIISAEYNGFDPTGLTPAQRKFAELIIKECLDQCYNKGMNDALYEGQLKAASYIEQHFGVE